MVTVHPYQADPKYKNNSMTCKACVKVLLYVDGIYAIIDTQMPEKYHDLLFQLKALDYGRNTDIGRLKKESRGHIFIMLNQKP